MVPTKPHFAHRLTPSGECPNPYAPSGRVRRSGEGPPLSTLPPDEARERFAAQRVARLATVGPEGRPHLVPVVFAVHQDTLATAVDGKPKSTARLRRLAHIAADPEVALLADHYDDDWTALWWARADGSARVLHSGPERAAALDRLAARYAPYRAERPDGPVIVVDVRRWSGWSYR
ncbi:TIGR03668 family PPOX class F420-dependent oxidoreductase [Allonocardiopsis opalescens]